MKNSKVIVEKIIANLNYYRGKEKDWEYKFLESIYKILKQEKWKKKKS